VTARLALTACLALAACGGEPNLMSFRASQSGPDEFLVAPAKPLEMPQDMAALPPPEPGGPNRADPTPEADAVAALGGRPQAAGGAAPASALVAHASRFGRQPDIRRTLAQEDLAFRRRNDGLFLERVFGTNIYYDAYRNQALDQSAELRRLRRQGVATPAGAPPGPGWQTE